MNSRERVEKTLNHEEPDRVPMFEIGINNQVAEYFLGRKVYVWGTGETTKVSLEAEMCGKEEFINFISNCYENALEVYYKAGLDMIPIYPTAFLHPINFGLHNVAVADIYDVEIRKESKTSYMLISKDKNAVGFWCSAKYAPEADTFSMHRDNIIEKGEKEFEKYVEYLEGKDLTKIPEQLQYGLDGLKSAIDTNNERYNLSLLGFADIEYPCFKTFHRLFLELMVTNGDLIHRYMRVTTDSMKAMLKIELEMGVDGILALQMTGVSALVL